MKAKRIIRINRNINGKIKFIQNNASDCLSIGTYYTDCGKTLKHELMFYVGKNIFIVSFYSHILNEDKINSILNTYKEALRDVA